MKRIIIESSLYFEEGKKVFDHIPQCIDVENVSVIIIDSEEYGKIKEIIHEPIVIENVYLLLEEKNNANYSVIEQLKVYVKENKLINIILDCSSCNQDDIIRILNRLQYDISLLYENLFSICIICHDNEVMKYANILTSFSRIKAYNMNEKEIDKNFRRYLRYSMYKKYFKNIFYLKLIIRIYRKFRKEIN